MRLTIALGVLAVAAGAPSGASASPSRDVVDPGCDQDHPSRVYASGDLAPLVRICASIDDKFYALAMYNPSATVLKVSLPDSALKPQVYAPTSQSVRTVLALQTVSYGCTSERPRVCRLPSGATLYSVILTPFTLPFDVDPWATISQNAANAIGQWVESRLIPRPLRFSNQIKACARAAGDLYHDTTVWSDALRSALTTSAACGGLIKLVERESTPVAKPQIATHVVRIAREFAGGNWIDELTVGIGKLIRLR